MATISIDLILHKSLILSIAWLLFIMSNMTKRTLLADEPLLLGQSDMYDLSIKCVFEAYLLYRDKCGGNS